jgi:hypothetical protein
MPYAQIEDGIGLYYELTGPGDAPQEAVRVVTEFVEQALVEA